MWLINCFLLIIGTVAAVCGISFYLRNKDAAGNIRFYICSYGVCAAVWCILFGFIGFCGDIHICTMMRKVADFAVDAFLTTEVFLVSEMSGAKRKTIRLFRGLEIVFAVIDFLVFSQSHVDLFIRENGYTTWVGNPAAQFNQDVHFLYILFTFLVLISFGIAWVRYNQLKRLRWFLFMVFLSNFTMLFFTLPDTFLPIMGIRAVSTSGMGAAACAIVIWYGATQIYSFDIRMGNIKDRLFDFIEAGVLVFDMDGQIAVVNHYAKSVPEREAGSDQRLHHLFEIDLATEEEMFRHAVDDIYSQRLWDRQGNRAFSLRLSAVKDNYGEPYCFLCVYVDVTEEVEAVSKFEVASHAKSRFLAQMSHEIRTPINAVLGMNEMILRESEDEDILDYAENISSAGNTLLALINSILDFSKIEDGKMDIIPVRYDTASFVNDLVNSILQRADEKGLGLDVNVDPLLPSAMVGDDVRFSQVIMNLLTNAVKYTEKGTITLTLRLEAAEKERARVFVSVEDTGIGIRQEDKEKLFVSFERLDEVRNRNIEGTGLGISIVKSLLEMMGSALSVESTYGEGSCFSFVLDQGIADASPMGDYEERLKATRDHDQKDDTIHAPGAAVLLVDDNEMNLKVARNLMKLCAIRPALARSGPETIQKMMENTYDIVFLDHMMPGMDGLETLKILQEESLVPPETAVIALTANAVVGARETYLAAGFTDYLSKPIEIKALVEKLRQYLPPHAYETLAEEEEAQAVSAPPEQEEEEAVMEFLPDEESGEAGALDYDLQKLGEAGIDTAAGLAYCAGVRDLYFEMVSDYAASAEEKCDNLDTYFDQENWEDYRIQVHAVKSNAKTIGANVVSQAALDLEQAAKNDDIAFIRARHAAFGQAYRKSAQDISKSV